MKKDFETFLNSIDDTELNQSWLQAKAENVKRKRVERTIFIIGVLIGIFVIYQLVPIDWGNIKFNLFIFMFPLILFFIGLLMVWIFSKIITFVLFSKSGFEYNNTYKEKVIDKLLKNFWDGVDYIPLKGMPEEVYRQGKFELYDDYYSEDYMEGTIDNKYRIKMAEVTTTKEVETRNSEGKVEKKTVTVFKGLFARILLQKSINNEIRISSSTKINIKPKVNMDSNEFEKYFSVYSKDKIFVMQILTHDIMNELIQLKKDALCDINIYINNFNMYIRFRTGKMFEAKLNESEIIDRNNLYIYFRILNVLEMLVKNMTDQIENI